MKLSFLLLLLFFVNLLSPQIVKAQIQINEVSSKSSPDWVEIYNNSPDAIDLSLYKLTDRAGNLKSLTGSLINGGFIAFDWHNKLDNDGDTIYLLVASNSAQIEEFTYGDPGSVCLPDEAGSVGRVDNGNTIERFSLSTKAQTNTGSVINTCPSPTPEPTPSPTVSIVPTPTKTATPTPTISISPTYSPKPTKTPSPRASPSPDDGNSLLESPEISLGSVDTDTGSYKNEKVGVVAGASTQKVPLIAYLLICLGTGFLLYGGYTLYNKKRAEKNS